MVSATALQPGQHIGLSAPSMRAVSNLPAGTGKPQ
jgi:hypothetical protein